MLPPPVDPFLSSNSFIWPSHQTYIDGLLVTIEFKDITLAVYIDIEWCKGRKGSWDLCLPPSEVKRSCSFMKDWLVGLRFISSWRWHYTLPAWLLFDCSCLSVVLWTSAAVSFRWCSDVVVPAMKNNAAFIDHHCWETKEVELVPCLIDPIRFIRFIQLFGMQYSILAVGYFIH